MNEIEEILLTHSRRYPLMEPTDYVKLLYQMHMGPGHLVTDPGMAVKRVSEERKEGETGVRLEKIGNGLVRCYLSGEDGNISTEAIADAFILTANSFMKQPEALRASLNTLTELSKSGALPGGIEKFNQQYVAEGMPMVSHSDTYRENYHPSYRVVYENLIKEKLL